MSDYEQHHYDKDLLAQAATEVGVLEVSPGADLEQVRNLINQMLEETSGTKIAPDWCFIDCKYIFHCIGVCCNFVLLFKKFVSGFIKRQIAIREM